MWYYKRERKQTLPVAGGLPILLKLYPVGLTGARLAPPPPNAPPATTFPLGSSIL